MGRRARRLSARTAIRRGLPWPTLMARKAGPVGTATILCRRARSREPPSVVGPLQEDHAGAAAAEDAPFIWRWRDIEPSADRAVAEVPIDDIERRALIMVNPAFGGDTVTTSNLIAAFTVLDPGDRARPHRHTFAAIRFATRAEGAATIVNGRRCEMRGRPDPDAADVLARPHQRQRPSHRLVRRRQHAADPRARRQFLRAGRAGSERVLAGRRRRGADLGGAGLVGADAARGAIRRSTAMPARRRAACFRPAAPARTARARSATSTRTTGGAVMPAFDCYAVRLSARRRRGSGARPTT